MADLPAAIEEDLARRGGRPINLYRALANHPPLLRAWVGMAWTLRTEASTPRRVRELMIVRGSMLCDCQYELQHHLQMAREAGVGEDDLEALRQWRASARFSDGERAALALMEEMLAMSLSDATASLLERHFSAAERVELILTAGFYAMVPRVLDALAVPMD